MITPLHPPGTSVFMNRWYTATIVAAVLFATGLLAATSDDSDAKGAEHTYIFMLTDGKEPIAGATVELELESPDDGTTSEKELGMTDGKGHAVIKTEKKAIRVMFDKIGYTVHSTCLSLRATDDDWYLISDVASSVTECQVTMWKTTLTAYLHNSVSNKGLENITVKSISRHSNPSECTTDSDGKFTVGIDSTCNVKLTIDMDGCTAIPTPYMDVENNRTVLLNLKGSVPELGCEYSIPGKSLSDREYAYEISNRFPIMMTVSTGDLTITVISSNNTRLVDAEVTIVNKKNGEEITKTTDKDGTATFGSINTGSYYYSISVGGFKPYDSRSDDGAIEVSQGGNAITQPMTEKVNRTFFGLNTGHALMLVGIAIGVFLALISYLLYTRRICSELSGNSE